MRVADFGVLHRNEFSGALHGLTRVRRFQQDDAHIFCRQDQMEEELTGFLKFLDECYEVFGLDYEMKLSTRPEGYLGELETWNKAEMALEGALKASGKEWELNPGDGAFYGPRRPLLRGDRLCECVCGRLWRTLTKVRRLGQSSLVSAKANTATCRRSVR